MFNRKNCIPIAFFLAVLLFAKGCDTLPFGLPNVKNNRLYGVTEGLFRHRWWNYYERALSFADGGFWEEAELDLNAAIRQRKNDQWRARTYGMHFIDYFPHCELGVIKYKQGDLETSVRELAVALETAKNARAEYYLDLARKDLIKKEQSDKNPPEIIIESPRLSSLTKDFFVDIRGIAKDDRFVRHITVSGKKIRTDVSAREIPFYMEVPVVPGKNTIPVVATDLTGKTSQTDVVINVDRIGPIISLDKSSEANPAFKTGIVLKGYASDDSGLAEVVINGRKISCNGEKTVQILETVRFQAGETELDVKAEDMAGNVTSANMDLSDRLKGMNRLNLLAENTFSRKIAQSDRSAGSVTPPVIELHNDMKERISYIAHTVIDGKVAGDVKNLIVRKCVVSDGEEERCMSVDEKEFSENPGGEFYFTYIIDLEKNEKAVNFIEIKAEGAGYEDSEQVTVRWKRHKALELESRLRMAVSDFRREGGASDDSFEGDLAEAMRDQERFYEPEHLKLDQSEYNTESKKCRAAKTEGFDCLLFGRIKKRNDNSMLINVRLKDAEDGTTILRNVNVYGNDVSSSSELELLARAMNYKLTDELPLVLGSVVDDPERKEVTVDIGGKKKVKRGMRLLVYEAGEVEEDDEVILPEETVGAKIRRVKKEKEESVARLTEKEDKVKKGQSVITR